MSFYFLDAQNHFIFDIEHFNEVFLLQIISLFISNLITLYLIVLLKINSLTLKILMLPVLTSLSVYLLLVLILDHNVFCPLTRILMVFVLKVNDLCSI